MSIELASAVADLRVAPEIAAAMKAVELPEVRDLMKQLAKYNLAVCIPHMHGNDMDFEVLPPDMVQVETDCHVAWLPRAQIETSPRHVPVAWRWGTDGEKQTAFCIQTCTPNDKSGHRRGHLKG